ncbi:MAG: hypothetical protein IJ279_07775 [Clostridia bacterium]|nr:hypothetical protein [Clostridia bacterium]
MKHTKKLLAIILAGLMVFSIFTVSASAKEMTKDEVIVFYHTLLKKTAEKHKVVKLEEDYTFSAYADVSELPLSEKLAVLAENGFSDKFEESDSCTYYIEGMNGYFETPEETDIYSWFETDSYIEYRYKTVSATYEGDKISIRMERDDGESESMQFEIYLTKNKGIKKIVEEWHCETMNSIDDEGTPFFATLTETKAYTFTYDKTPATSLTVSESSVKLGYKDVVKLDYEIGPDNVTFKEADVNYLNELEEFDSSVIYAYESDGKIVIEANGEGTGFVEVFTHTGDCREMIEVTVEYDFFDRIHIMFDEMIENIKVMFGVYDYGCC